jgi:phage/plasmid-associated DNA primase
LLVRLQGEYDVTAWDRRLLQINFPRSIRQEDRIPNYDSVLLAEEAQGILTCIIEGAKAHLAELEECGDFILSAEQKQRLDQLLTESEALRFFVEEAIMRKAGHDLETIDITQAFMDFCDEREWAVLTTRQIELRLRDLMLEIHRSAWVNKTRRDGDDEAKPRGGRGYKDVAFKPKAGDGAGGAAENYARDDAAAAEYVDEDRLF